MRRGMTVEGLQEFVLTQGMSKARAVNKQQPLRKQHWREICQWGIFSTGRFEYLSSPKHFRLARELDKFERLWLQSLQGNQHDGVGQDLGHQQAEAATPWISSWYGRDYIIVTNGDLIWFDAAVLTTWWSFRAEDWSCSAAVCSCCWWCSDGPIFFTTKCIARFGSFLFWYVDFFMYVTVCLIVFRLYISLCLLPTAPVGLICVLWGSSFLGRPGWATEYNDKALPLMALTQSTLRVRKLKMLKRKDFARLDLLYHAWATIQCNQGWHRFTFMFLTCFPNSSCVLAALEV